MYQRSGGCDFIRPRCGLTRSFSEVLRKRPPPTALQTISHRGSKYTHKRCTSLRHIRIFVLRNATSFHVCVLLVLICILILYLLTTQLRPGEYDVHPMVVTNDPIRSSICPICPCDVFVLPFRLSGSVVEPNQSSPPCPAAGFRDVLYKNP